MRALAIAKRDFTDARRSNVLWIAIGLFVAFVGIVFATTSTDRATPAENALWNIQAIAIWFLPIVVLVVGYLAVAGERETGRIKYLLGLPNSRRDVVLGKFLSRAGISVLAVAISMAVGLVVLFVRYPSVPVETFLGMALFMAVFAVVYTAIAVGISALASTRARSMTGVIGVYMFFTVFWIVPNVSPAESLSYIVEELLGLSAKPNLYEFVFYLSPSFAYSRLSNVVLFERAQNGAQLPGADAPFYLQGEFMPVILLAWVVGMLLVGYLRFRDAELA
ncbi:ABC transporter permease [Halovenus marina]|uniref:ABC transporter permease n=1 Tax=Halovenus marina TaxID=3396621 RepID=UPI003F5793B6